MYSKDGLERLKDGLESLKVFFSSQLEKVKEYKSKNGLVEIFSSKFKKVKDDKNIEIKNILENLLKKIDNKNIDKETIKYILKNNDFTNFIKSPIYLSKNVKEKSKIEPGIFYITSNYNQKIVEHQVEHQTESRELKIIGEYTYFLNINLGTDKNKRIFQHIFLNIPIFNNTQYNKTLYDFANSPNSPIIVVANLAFKNPNSIILANIEKLDNFMKQDKNKSPEDVYYKYFLYFYDFTSGGSKKRIVNTTSNKKRGRKNKKNTPCKNIYTNKFTSKGATFQINKYNR